MKKPVVSIALAASLSIGSLGTHTVFAQKNEAVNQYVQEDHLDRKILKRINADHIYKNIEYLSKVPRVAGTDSELNGVNYIEKQFKSYGYKTEVQPFKFIGYTPPTKIELSVEGFSGNLDPKAFTYSVSGKVTGVLVDAGLGKKEELQNKDLTGKIAFIKRGEISFGEKVLNAAEKGAAGVIIYNNSSGSLSGTLGGANDRYVPVVGLSKAEGEALAASLNKTASLNIEGAETSEKTSHNVIATKKPTIKQRATDDMIVLGAHHDSVPGAPGANDDASGTATTLELARVLKDVPTDTELRFVTFGAEELGLLGSYHYVESLSQDETNRTIANFNLDMVGSKDAGDLVMLTLDGQPNLVTELGQASSAKLNGAATPFGQGGRSDHVPFAEAGIPAALFIHSPSEPWYHSPEDTIDKISKEKLQDVAEIVGSAVYERARIDQRGPAPKKEAKKSAIQEMIFEQAVK